ncbi:MAG: hypothetical protein CMM52_01385 [Rhodospirillaceae bacterium]|nr:hypothetical protein [Rhodospirillaceae bacterium]|tara:strand:+ start:166 stop:807 length:642 start_codon:yes stop_codon:yes gene_type:complete
MFAENQAIPLFPTFVWMHQLNPEDTVRINNTIRAKLLSLLGPDAQQHENKANQTNQNLHTLPEFQEFNQVLLKATKGVMDFLHVAEEGIEITSCWANMNTKGAVNPAHTHPNNYLGGVYYVDTPENSGSIVFEDPRAQPRLISPRVSQSTRENSGRATLNVEPGTLLLFPAWLVHSVEPNPSENLRISISFNLMFSSFTEKVSPVQWTGNIPT